MIVTMLQKYQGKASKNLFVIPPALLKTLIVKFTPVCKLGQAK
jgi:hypothetical protein